MRKCECYCAAATILVVGFLFLAGTGMTQEMATVQYDTISTWSGTTYYRCTVEGGGGVDGVIRVTAVESYRLFVNGTLKGVSPDTLWKTLEVYAVTSTDYTIIKKDTLLELGIEVTNSGNGLGNGLYVEIDIDTLRVTSSLNKRTAVWYWTGVPQTDDSWTTLNVTDPETTPDWTFVQNGDIHAVEIENRRNIEGEVIAGFYENVDRASISGGGLSLKTTRGENYAFDRPSNVSKVVDGRLVTDWQHTSPPLHFKIFIDLEHRRKVNRVDVYTSGNDLAQFMTNSLRGFSVQVSDDRYRWSEVAVKHEVGLVDLSEHDTQIVEIEPAKDTRYIQLEVTEVRPGSVIPKVSEVNIFGIGYAFEGEYISDPINFANPSLKNFGMVNWDADVPDNTSLTMQFRSANSVAVLDTTRWSQEYTVSGIYPAIPEPMTYVQYKINLETKDTEIRPVLRTIDFSHSTDYLAVSSVKGAVVPNDIYMGQDTTFTYIIDYTLTASDSGIASIVLNVPSLVDTGTVSMVSSAPGSLPSYNKRVNLDSLIISFDNPLTAVTATDTLYITFNSKLFNNAHALRGYLFAPNSTNPLNIAENRAVLDATENLYYSWNIYSLDVLDKTLVEVKPNPRVFTPNGDGICDYTVFGFVLAKVESADITIKIFDLNGRMIHFIERTDVVPGDYTRWLDDVGAQSMPGYWDGKNKDKDLVPPGIYLYQVEVNVDVGDQVASGTVIVSY